MKTIRTFDDLLENADKSHDDKLNDIIDTELLPHVANRMSHRMYNLTKHHTFECAKDLFAQVMQEVAEWFGNDEFYNKGWKLTFSDPDQHGRTTLTFTLALFHSDRMYNLTAFVSKNEIFNSTHDNLFQ